MFYIGEPSALDRVLDIRMPEPAHSTPARIGVLNIGVLDIRMSEPAHSTPTRIGALNIGALDIRICEPANSTITLCASVR